MTTRSLFRPIRLFVAGVAVAALGFLTLAANAQPGGPHYGGPHHGGRGMMMDSPEGMGRMADRILDSVSASDAQRAQVKQIMQAAATDLRAQREAGRGLREQTMQLFTQPTVDAATAESLRQQMLAQHDQASRRMMQAMLEVSKVLTPEQRAQLAERTKQRRDMFERHRRERQSIDGAAPKS